MHHFLLRQKLTTSCFANHSLWLYFSFLKREVMLTIDYLTVSCTPLFTWNFLSGIMVLRKLYTLQILWSVTKRGTGIKERATAVLCVYSTQRNTAQNKSALNPHVPFVLCKGRRNGEPVLSHNYTQHIVICYCSLTPIFCHKCERENN